MSNKRTIVLGANNLRNGLAAARRVLELGPKRSAVVASHTSNEGCHRVTFKGGCVAEVTVRPGEVEVVEVR